MFHSQVRESCRREHLTHNVSYVEAIGESPRRPVSRGIDPVRKGVSSSSGRQVVVVATVDEGIAEDEEGAGLRRCRGAPKDRDEGDSSEEKKWLAHGCSVGWNSTGDGRI
ncbi:hypothetical protein BHM03_00050599 [Ensete ventricosum]|nr:hypothetical protein BHM03_00050599 [Ensete ventricosum]